MSNVPDSPGSGPADSPDPQKQPAEKVRWYHLFRQSSDPLFVLNHQRRILFVNAAWEELTGFSLAQVRGWSCKPRTRVPSKSHDALRTLLSPLADTSENIAALESRFLAVLTALSPPADVLQGQSVQVRRLGPGMAQHWDVCFFPLRGDKKLRGIVGKVVSFGSKPRVAQTPLPAKLFTLRDRFQQWHRLDQFEPATPLLQRIRDQMRLACQTFVPVWISGEAGTGKEWTARTIHRHGLTSDRCFMALDCGRLPAVVVETALFGPCGVISLPRTGTVYLKDSHFLPRELQARICQWWKESQHWESEAVQTGQQSGESTLTAKTDVKSAALVRLLAGSSLNLDSDTAAKTLLDEFRYTFSVLTISLPPLRERKGDFDSLVRRLLTRAAASADHDVSDLSPQAWDCLHAASWPGNLRELYAVLRQACLRTKEAVLDLKDLPWYLRDSPVQQPQSLPLDELLHQAERRLLQLAMQWSGDNKSKAADILSIPRSRLLRRLKELDMEGED